MMDHGYKVDDGRRCTATTKKVQQCQMHPLLGINLCALHSGLARAKLSSGYGDPKALEAFKRAHKA